MMSPFALVVVRGSLVRVCPQYIHSAIPCKGSERFFSAERKSGLFPGLFQLPRPRCSRPAGGRVSLEPLRGRPQDEPLAVNLDGHDPPGRGLEPHPVARDVGEPRCGADGAVEVGVDEGCHADQYCRSDGVVKPAA